MNISFHVVELTWGFFSVSARKTNEPNNADQQQESDLSVSKPDQQQKRRKRLEKTATIKQTPPSSPEKKIVVNKEPDAENLAGADKTSDKPSIVQDINDVSVLADDLIENLEAKIAEVAADWRIHKVEVIPAEVTVGKVEQTNGDVRVERAEQKFTNGAKNGASDKKERAFNSVLQSAECYGAQIPRQGELFAGQSVIVNSRQRKSSDQSVIEGRRVVNRLLDLGRKARSLEEEHARWRACERTALSSDGNDLFREKRKGRTRWSIL